jgi:phosphoserine aminotransferase
VSRKVFFTPGPAHLYPTYENHLKSALDAQIPSISHRSNQFRSIYQDTFESLKELFNLPDGYAILFTSSATEIWERLIQNCVEESSFHLVNGEFSRKFYEFAGLLGKKAHRQEAVFGEGFELDKVEIDYKSELIAVVHNETSSGVAMPEADIHALKAKNSKRLVVVDMVSSAPYPRLDFSQIDSAYFSVQKAFGMPAGLGVWLVKETCLAKAEVLQKKSLITGTYHRLTNLWKFFEKYETPETPNVLAIYLLGKIAQDMLVKGIEKIRQETDHKAQLLYDFFASDARFSVFVKNPAHRSPTVVVANTQMKAGDLIKQMTEKGMVLGSGYKDYKDSQIRVANFPAVSVEETEKLISEMKSL